MRTLSCAAACALAASVAIAAGAPALRSAAKVLDGKHAIDVEVGHATPNVVDWDGDGKRDLLVGQFGGGKLRVYRNVGTDAAPAFKGFEYAKAGGADAHVPVS